MESGRDPVFSSNYGRTWEVRLTVRYIITTTRRILVKATTGESDPIAFLAAVIGHCAHKAVRAEPDTDIDIDISLCPIWLEPIVHTGSNFRGAARGCLEVGKRTFAIWSRCKMMLDNAFVIVLS